MQVYRKLIVASLVYFGRQNPDVVVPYTCYQGLATLHQQVLPPQRSRSTDSGKVSSANVQERYTKGVTTGEKQNVRQPRLARRIYLSQTAHQASEMTWKWSSSGMLRPTRKARHALVADGCRQEATMGSLFKHRRLARGWPRRQSLRPACIYRFLAGFDNCKLLVHRWLLLPLQSWTLTLESRSASILTSISRCHRRHRLQTRPLAGIKVVGPIFFSSSSDMHNLA
jgi:hypothetical protein